MQTTSCNLQVSTAHYIAPLTLASERLLAFDKVYKKPVSRDKSVWQSAAMSMPSPGGVDAIYKVQAPC